MTTRRGPLMLCAAICVLATTTGCTIFRSGAPWPGAPAWAWRDISESYPDDGKEHLYARDMSDKMLTEELTRKRAMGNTRKAMAEELEGHVAELMRNWMSTSQDIVDSSTAEGQRFTEIVSRHFTEAHLYGCSEVAWTVRPDTGAMYMLMRMPYKGNTVLRDEVRRHAEETLSEEKEKVVTGDIENAMKSLDAYLEAQLANP